MKYFEVKFTIKCADELMQDARDVLSALAGEAGFETFTDTDEGLTGYVQQQIFDKEALDAVLSDFPFGADCVVYTVAEAEDRDWNEQWEQEGFEPIVVAPSWPPPRGRDRSHPQPLPLRGGESRRIPLVGDFSSPQGGIRGGLIIHDGRHLPDLTLLNTSLSIEIDAHLAFGTGTHETTRLMCRRLMELDLNGKRVLDCGCGTGILAIAALKLGAATALAYDIDEWSVDNTRHNAVINQVDNRLEAAHGDATLLYNMQPESFQVVMANINRNILMADMPQFVRMMTPDGRLLLSGFYREDVPLLAEKAAELGLTVTDVSEDNGWACMMLKNYKFQS